MNLKAEKKKIQSLNKTELRSYEAENKRLLAEAREKAKEAQKARGRLRKAISVPGIPEQALVKEIQALEEIRALRELNSEIQKRKNQLLTPQEKAKIEATKRALFKRLEMLSAN